MRFWFYSSKTQDCTFISMTFFCHKNAYAFHSKYISTSYEAKFLELYFRFWPVLDQFNIQFIFFLVLIRMVRSTYKVKSCAMLYRFLIFYRQVFLFLFLVFSMYALLLKTLVFKTANIFLKC